MFQQESRDADRVKLKFSPNPKFRPSGSSEFVFHHMEGTLTLDLKQKRLVEISGRLNSDVKFAGGLLGHLDKGGTFFVRQQEVTPGHWEMTRMDVQMNGKALFFKTISVRTNEIDTDFHARCRRRRPSSRLRHSPIKQGDERHEPCSSADHCGSSDQSYYLHVSSPFARAQVLRIIAATRSSFWARYEPLLSYDESRKHGEVVTTETWVTVVGSLGGICTTFAFVPQVLKIWKQGGRDLSYGMLALYLIGAILWLTYGILLRARAVIIANFATAIVIAIATALKAWTARRDSAKEIILSATEQG